MTDVSHLVAVYIIPVTVTWCDRVGVGADKLAASRRMASSLVLSPVRAALLCTFLPIYALRACWQHPTMSPFRATAVTASWCVTTPKEGGMNEKHAPFPHFIQPNRQSCWASTQGRPVAIAFFCVATMDARQHLSPWPRLTRPKKCVPLWAMTTSKRAAIPFLFLRAFRLNF